jgi:hypothetical protein
MFPVQFQMMQVIGFIIAIYAIARLMQAPMVMGLGEFGKVLPQWLRVIGVGAVSTIAILLIGLLALVMIGMGHEASRMGQFR